MEKIPTVLSGRTTYIGDGVYVSYDLDRGIKFQTSRAAGLHEIFLNEPTLECFEEFLKEVRRTLKEFRKTDQD